MKKLKLRILALTNRTVPLLQHRTLASTEAAQRRSWAAEQGPSPGPAAHVLDLGPTAPRARVTGNARPGRAATDLFLRCLGYRRRNRRHFRRAATRCRK